LKKKDNSLAMVNVIDIEGRVKEIDLIIVQRKIE
jgi:hypothetical protein